MIFFIFIVYQINRRMEFVFASHSFDVWESWMLEGSLLQECRLVNCRNPLVSVFPFCLTGLLNRSIHFCFIRTLKSAKHAITYFLINTKAYEIDEFKGYLSAKYF